MAAGGRRKARGRRRRWFRVERRRGGESDRMKGEREREDEGLTKFDKIQKFDSGLGNGVIVV